MNTQSELDRARFLLIEHLRLLLSAHYVFDIAGIFDISGKYIIDYNNLDVAATEYPDEETINVSGSDMREHVVGDTFCSEGYCGPSGYPFPCKCGGLIHADRGKGSNCDSGLYMKCDQCGMTKRRGNIQAVTT